MPPGDRFRCIAVGRGVSSGGRSFAPCGLCANRIHALASASVTITLDRSRTPS